MPKLTEHQKKVVTAFQALDAHIGKCVMPVAQASELAMLFGQCARAVDEALQIDAGIRPEARHEDKPPLEIV